MVKLIGILSIATALFVVWRFLFGANTKSNGALGHTPAVVFFAMVGVIIWFIVECFRL